jgi:hypothetical protein
MLIQSMTKLIDHVLIDPFNQA